MCSVVSAGRMLAIAAWIAWIAWWMVQPGGVQLLSVITLHLSLVQESSCGAAKCHSKTREVGLLGVLLTHDSWVASVAFGGQTLNVDVIQL